jgi:Bacteriophage HK97-gp10, putative tail-component
VVDPQTRHYFRSVLVGKEIARRTLKVHTVAVRGCPVKTGRLRSSIRWRMGKDGRGLFGLVGTDVEYAGLIHSGTRPHIIVPKSKMALYWKGAQHPVRVVHHPGTKARPFLLNALREAL